MSIAPLALAAASPGPSSSPSPKTGSSSQSSVATAWLQPRVFGEAIRIWLGEESDRLFGFRKVGENIDLFLSRAGQGSAMLGRLVDALGPGDEMSADVTNFTLMRFDTQAQAGAAIDPLFPDAGDAPLNDGLFGPLLVDLAACDDLLDRLAQ